MLLSANLLINKAADYHLFVHNTIIIKHSGEINMLSRHAFGILLKLQRNDGKVIHSFCQPRYN